MSKRLFTAGADVACRDKCLGSAALGASMQQGRGLCAGSEPGSALPPVRAAPQPQSCSLIAHLPSSHTAAQGKAGKDQSRALYPALSGYEKPSQLLFPSSGGPWSVLRFPRGSSKPQQRGWPREGSEPSLVVPPQMKSCPRGPGCCGEGLVGENRRDPAKARWCV